MLRSRRSVPAEPRAFTLVEMMVVIGLVVIIAAYLAQTFYFAGRSERAVNKKALVTQVLQYVQGRIRRDARWARKVKVLGGGQKGPGIEFSDVTGSEKRTYSWDSGSSQMKIPDIDKPTNSSPYTRCKFRYVEFYLNEAGGEGVRVVMAPIPNEENPSIAEPSGVWGAAMVGRTELDYKSECHRYQQFNDPNFNDYPEKKP